MLNYFGGDKMTDYKELYFTLSANVATAIEALQNAQCEAEQMYMLSELKENENIGSEREF